MGYYQSRKRNELLLLKMVGQISKMLLSKRNQTKWYVILYKFSFPTRAYPSQRGIPALYWIPA